MCKDGKTSVSAEEITCFVVKRLNLKQLSLCYVREKIMPCIHINISLSDPSRVEKMTFWSHCKCLDPLTFFHINIFPYLQSSSDHWIYQIQVWKLRCPQCLSFNEKSFHSLEMCTSIHGKVANLMRTFSFPQLLKFNLDHFPPLVNKDYIIGCQQNHDWTINFPTNSFLEIKTIWNLASKIWANTRLTNTQVNAAMMDTNLIRRIHCLYLSFSFSVVGNLKYM